MSRRSVQPTPAERAVISAFQWGHIDRDTLRDRLGPDRFNALRRAGVVPDDGVRSAR